MKIRYRILFINFAIVVLIIASSAIAFYSIMYNSLTSQRSRNLTRAANNFFYAYREMIQDTEDDFQFYIKNPHSVLSLQNLKNIDFVIEGKRNTDYLIPLFSKENILFKKKNLLWRISFMIILMPQ